MDSYEIIEFHLSFLFCFVLFCYFTVRMKSIGANLSLNSKKKSSNSTSTSTSVTAGELQQQQLQQQIAGDQLIAVGLQKRDRRSQETILQEIKRKKIMTTTTAETETETAAVDNDNDNDSDGD